ncbi:Caspase 8, apoptosis- cysteine peptidase [Desmophyllum pertusum]|uniref:Caspase 8, apoptosis- cysteine peptidase n=1 Tax=Desmophyllum pertusum TaxID=174260 RepID=A0A9W9ZQF7_9CNID|nr:Caspase 8, apoptosis- cysteine peptidase [Desmophyllum pertusum]
MGVGAVSFRRIFNRPFDSRSCHGASSAIVQFYDNKIRSGNVLCVYRDLKTNRIHFVINGKEAWVSFSSGAPDVCYGYVRLSSGGNDSNIQVTVVQEKEEAYFNSVMEPAPVVEHENMNRPWWMPVVRVGQLIHHEITELSHYRMSVQHPRGICLLINNVPNMVSEEKQLTDLFEHLSFDVQVRQNLQMLQIYEVAQEFAKKDHSEFDSFAVIIMSVCGQDNEIFGVDGKKASLENVMSEFTATNCSSLQGKAKLFFVQRFTMTPSKVGDGSTQAHCYCTDKDVRPFSPCTILGGDGCPDEADFLLTCVTSPVDGAKPVPESLFLQVRMCVKGAN